MKKKSDGRERAALIALIILLLVPSYAAAISISAPATATVAENQTINLDITASAYSGTVAFARQPEKGTLARINDSLASFSWTPTLLESGTYAITFTAGDSSGEANATTMITVTDVNIPPQILSRTQDKTVNEARVTISAETSAAATCRYSLSDKPYPEMEYTMSTDSGIQHSGTTPGLAQGDASINIRCSSQYGVMTRSEVIRLTVNLRPTASITISPSPPLGVGTMDVQLTTSEELIGSPELKYNYNDDQSLKTITLVGSGTSWHGYLIINDGEVERVGSFFFKGNDRTNLEGTEIASGQIFLVDTKKPVQIQSISIKDDEDLVKITWSYDDDVDEYRIYRKEKNGGADYVDYYDTTTKTSYVDSDVEYKQAYYYRVTAVDEADNEGPLSREVYVTHMPSQEADVPAKGLDAKLAVKLDAKLKEVDKLALDVSEARQRLERTLGTDNVEVIGTLGLIPKARQREESIKTVAEQMRALKNEDLTGQEFEDRTKKMLDDASAFAADTPTGVTIADSATYEELIDDERTRTSLNEYYDAKGLGEITEELASNIVSLQDRATVTTTLIRASVSYAQKAQQYSLVKKSISAAEPIDNAYLLEKIPKQVAASASEMIFSEQPEIIMDDPLVKFETGRLTSKQYTYAIPHDIPIAELRGIKTIIGIHEDRPEQDSLTGHVASDENAGEPTLFMPLAVAIAVAALLFGYYVFSGESNPAGKGIQSVFSSFGNVFARKPQQMDDARRRISITELSQPAKRKADDDEIIAAAQYDYSFQQQEPEAHESPPTELGELHEKLQRYKQQIQDSDLEVDEMERLNGTIMRIKGLCDEIETSHNRSFAMKTQKQLEQALNYINRHLKQEDKGEKIAPGGKEFVLADGRRIASVRELAESIKGMDDATFRSHVDEKKNDFANWIRDVFEEYDLAHSLRGMTTKEQIAEKLSAS